VRFAAETGGATSAVAGPADDGNAVNKHGQWRVVSG
jgi:hypothetical protein